ncbi:MAG: NAD-dependent epimerase/dehydratase family protein, partial [Janthinobacterium lividum]
MVDKFVLLTGGTGFIGSNIISYLKENSINTKSLSREEVWGDLSFDGDVDVIIHTAGKAHDLKQTGNVSEYYKANYELTKKLYDAFLVSKAKRFIFISSVKAIADDAQETL